MVGLGQDAEQILDMVPDFVGDHIGIGEIAAAAELALHLLEEGGVEIDLAVVRAIERPHRRLRHAAAGAVDAGEQYELRRLVAGVGLLRQHLGPDVLVLRQHGRDEAAHLVLRRAGGLARLRRLLAPADAADHLGAADQKTRIDAECPAEQAEHHHRADADAAATAGHAGEAAATTSPPVLEIVGLAVIFPLHGQVPDETLRHLAKRGDELKRR